MAITTRKPHTRFKRGTSMSQTIPGSMVLAAGEHFVSVFCNARRKKIAGISRGLAMSKSTNRCQG
jgi:hypothetical protein